MRDKQPFDAYLAELDRILWLLPPAQQAEIRRELLAHLADAAAEREQEPDGLELQRAVIAELGSSDELGALFLEVYRSSTRRQAAVMASKRVFDLVLALIHLVLLAPVLLAIAIGVKLDSRGSLLYMDRRLGRNGQPFRLYKFRTMIAAPDGMRITRFGRLLRRYGLDELPQLWNVVAGDMSLIGPRPAAPDEPDPTSAIWSDILRVRPGLTGLAQLETERTFPKTARQLELDAVYISSRSLGLDLRLLLRTARGIWRGV